VAVVGAGVAGLAAAAELARRGVRTVVYEQFSVGHPYGSSHGRSRIFRLAYPEPGWVRLAVESLDGWRSLERETGTPIVEQVGLVEIVGDLADSSIEALRECALPYEVLEADDAERRFAIRVEEGEMAVLEPFGGYVRADEALSAFLEVAARGGAELREGERVADLGAIEADAVVVAAGAWARDLLAQAGIDLPVHVTRETVAYFRLGGDRPVPSVAKLRPGTHRHAVYGLHDPDFGLKLGCHFCGPEADPDAPGEPDAAIVDELSRWALDVFPGVDPQPAAAETCLYTSTSDEDFVLERHGRIVVGSACSGHGFKFGPAIGERLALLALEALDS